MKSPIKINLKRWLLTSMGSLTMLFLTGFSISIYIEDKIAEQILSFNGKTSSIKINLFTRSLTVKDLEWNSTTDTIKSNQHIIMIKRISVRGISLYQLIVNKNLLVTDIILDSGKIQYNKTIKHAPQKESNSKYRAFSFENISLINIETVIKADTIVHFSALLNCHLTGTHIKIDSLNTLKYSAKTADATIERINISRHEGMYGGRIARIYFNSQKQKATIDSALLIPNFGKYEFAQHLDEQTSRVSISVPQVVIIGLKFKEIMDSSFVAARIEINSFDLFSFMDKRIPFLRKKNVPLPMESFLKLHSKIIIDSIIIKNSRITVEEFPEKGIKSGVVTFNDVNATFTGLTNRINENNHAYALLNANGFLMGSGRIQATFQFPVDGSLVYKVEGSISKMPFSKLNPLLENMADVQIKSGYLNALRFNFNYTDFTSKGHLEINYENLRITSRNKNKHSTNQIKTLLVNAMVNNNKTKSTSLLKRTGIIDIERNRKRFIFNVWSKSILDGIKSSIFETKKIDRDSKKRLTQQ